MAFLLTIKLFDEYLHKFQEYTTPFNVDGYNFVEYISPKKDKEKNEKQKL